MSKSQYHLEYAAWALKSEQSKSLLSSDRSVPQYGAVAPSCDSSLLEGKKKTIGFWSAVFIIFNRIIGTGYVYMLPMTLCLRLTRCLQKDLRHASGGAFPQRERWDVDVCVISCYLTILTYIFAGRSGW